MRSLLVALALVPALAADAGPRDLFRNRDELRLVFLDADERASVRHGALGDATLDVGTVRATSCTSGCMRTVVRRRFRVRVDGGSPATRSVRVRAFVQGDTAGQRVRIDGRVLTASPQLIDAAAPLHVATTHTLEVEVPTSEAPGPLAHTISWIVEDSP